MEYNYKIDSIKFWCSIAVVLIHLTAFIQDQGIATISNFYIYRYFLNIAVPFFFASAGYLIALKTDKNYIPRYIKKIFIMYLFFSVFYLFVNFIYILSDRIFLKTPFRLDFKILMQGITTENIVLGTFGGWHLWFLTALIIGSILLYISLHFRLSETTILLLSFFIFIADLLKIFNLDKINYYNGSTKAFLFLSMGYYVSKKNIKIRYSKTLFILAMIMYSLDTMYIQNSTNDLFLVLATFFLIYYCKTHKEKKSIISSLGKHSLDIYIMHVFVYETIYKIFDYIGITNYNDSVWKILLTTILCIIFSILLFKPLNILFQKIQRLINSCFM